MICRIWHGWTAPPNGDAYETLLRSEIFTNIRNRGIAGFRGIELLRRDRDDACEFVTVMWFDDLDAVRAFAGADYETAVVPPKARALLSRFDERSAHFSVVEGGPGAGNEVSRIMGEVRRAIHGEPWHGSSIGTILADVDADVATQRPLPQAHTIWEIVLHLTGWVREVIRRLDGAPPGVPPQGDWPAVDATSPAAWERARTELDVAHRELLAALARTREAQLFETIAGPDASSQDAVTRYQTLHGLVQHDAYHAGQIAVLKKGARR
jgi:uncharacterized damage-inducible protein DinB/heme-degrading monooxygenase HmoA